MKFWDDVEDSSYFPMPLPDCLLNASFRRYSPLSKSPKNRANVKVFWPPIFAGETTQTFLQQVVSRAKFGFIGLGLTPGQHWSASRRLAFSAFGASDLGT